jgi:hypothetical protein
MGKDEASYEGGRERWNKGVRWCDLHKKPQMGMLNKYNRWDLNSTTKITSYNVECFFVKSQIIWHVKFACKKRKRKKKGCRAKEQGTCIIHKD